MLKKIIHLTPIRNASTKGISHFANCSVLGCFIDKFLQFIHIVIFRWIYPAHPKSFQKVPNMPVWIAWIIYIIVFFIFIIHCLDVAKKIQIWRFYRSPVGINIKNKMTHKKYDKKSKL